MKYNVKWIISGNIDINSESKEAAENEIKVTLEKIIEKNNSDFKLIGADAIQGSASIIK